ncbi:helix-turn-helix transcriptional regulator [Phormidium sp. CLA17]|uniref:ArsR/SmtB family transcription factor n=1 Tax=Leptolyngbya sp. Cla-17 TaxID=2803751 RepID=UPI001492AB69|nr:metalloregulator ArsR/SmtB family transcription factor [Leptolyngbya sp. Cla-17]MBM0740058.1 helix-turn-helix transcriptional regulator [Leptolyngbya sp. Cla-17]
MPDNLTEIITENFEDGEDFCCELPHPDHSDPADLAQTETLTVEQAQRMSEFFGFLADTNRLRILSKLAAKEMCVGDLAIALEMNESAVSHQLRTLRTIRLVSFRKQGRHVFYRLQDHHVLNFYQAIIEHLDETLT